jgi:hypothetical protein
MTLLTASAFALAPFSVANAQESCGNLNKTEWNANFQGQTLNSETFVRLDQSSTPFTVRGSGESCVLVDFSIVGNVVSVNGFGNNIRFRAILDAAGSNPITSAGQPAQMIQQPPNGENDAEAHSFQFVFPGVAPGQHDVAIQYKVQNAGSQVPSGGTDQWIMTVRHR